MMKRKFLVAALAVFCFSAFAQTNIKDVRTNPDLFFLKDGEQASSLDLLPPPPEIGSLQWFNDEARYYWGLKQRNTPRGDQAAADANVEDVAMNFSDAFGYTPRTKHVLVVSREEANALGQNYVGFDDDIQPSTQFGTNCLRMGRKLEKGFVVTDEPGIYFIPALIDDWRAKGLHQDFINYDKVEGYKDFGGIRIEDDILITDNGCRFLGEERIPYHPKDVEEYMSNN